MSFQTIPAELKTTNNWVVWKYETRDDNTTKVPYDAKSNGNEHHAKSNDSETWTSFDRAVEVADILKGSDYDGVGFMLQGTSYVGIDFDGVLHDGKPEPFVEEILKHLGNPYTEITPSGNGLRAFVQCSELPPGQRKFSSNKYGAEIYIGSEGGRYLTVTGNHLLGKGIPMIQDIRLAYLLISQIHNLKFKNLWMGDTSAYDNDHSCADLALVSMLARLLKNDASRIEKYFGASILGQRGKWMNRENYRQPTIAKAISGKDSTTNNQMASKELEFHLPAITTGTDYDFVIDPASDQTDGWFPLGSPSLVGGSSGSNKSTWMMRLLSAQANRESFLGHSTSGRPYLILMADRGPASHQRTMRRMRMDHENVPIKFLSPKMGMEVLQEIVDNIEGTSPLPQIVFIEGADMLVEDANKKQIVGPFMSALQKIATHYHIAIVGSVGAPKCKAGEGYVAKRDNISGTEAWSRLAETVVLLQYPKGKDTVAERELTVLPRNAPAESFMLVMKHGRLELQTEEDRRHAENDDRELQWVKTQDRIAKKDPTKKWWTISDMMRSLEMSQATAYRWVRDAHAKDHITEKPGSKGRSKAAQFHWNDTKTNPLWFDHEENDTEGVEL